jgi:outer membrane receptor for ferrienterochelin and colicin
MKFKLIACAAMVFARAYAQETPPVVQVKASADLQRQRDTAARTTITREEILKYGDANALEVMKRLPGVSIGEGGPRMRGLGAGYTQILVNGDRPPPGLSLENLTPEMIDKIEVMRSALAEHSTQAVAGTINIVQVGRQAVARLAGLGHAARSPADAQRRPGTGRQGRCRQPYFQRQCFARQQPSSRAHQRAGNRAGRYRRQPARGG